ncbi:MAG: hypothetical protein RIS70_2603 [Planctomycetota bacterium]|jgi:hypothetical protein
MSDLTVYRWLLRLCDPEGYTDLPATRLTANAVGKLIAISRQHGVTGIVLRNLKQVLDIEGPATLLTNPHDGAATALAIKLAEEDCLPEIAQTLLLRARTGSLLAAIHRAGVDAAIVKGEDFADRLYELPGLRPFRDIDLLLRREQIDSLDELMHKLGFRFVRPEGKYNDEYGERTWDSVGAPRVRVEFHWNMITCPSQRRSSSLAWSDLDWIAEGNRMLPSPESMLVIACAHAVISHRFDRLQHLCDIRQICRARAGELACEKLREIVLHCGLSAAVTGALEVTSRLLHDVSSSDLLRQLQLPASAAPWRLLVSGASLLGPSTRVNQLRRTAIREWMKRSA